MQAAKQATTLDPKNAYAFSTMGWAYEALQKDKEAYSAYARALEINPKLAPAQYAVGEGMCKRGDIGEAQDASRKLAHLDSALKDKLDKRIKQGCP